MSYIFAQGTVDVHQDIPSGVWTRIVWPVIPDNNSSVGVTATGEWLHARGTDASGLWMIIGTIAWENVGVTQAHRRKLRLVQNAYIPQFAAVAVIPAATTEQFFDPTGQDLSTPSHAQVVLQAGFLPSPEPNNRPVPYVALEVFQDSGSTIRSMTVGIEAPLYMAARLLDARQDPTPDTPLPA